VLGACHRSRRKKFWGNNRLHFCFWFQFLWVLQSLIVGKVTLTSKRLRILPIVGIIVVLQGDLETFDAILLSIFSLTLHGDSNIRYVFIDSIE